MTVVSHNPILTHFQAPSHCVWWQLRLQKFTPVASASSTRKTLFVFTLLWLVDAAVAVFKTAKCAIPQNHHRRLPCLLAAASLLSFFMCSGGGRDKNIHSTWHISAISVVFIFRKVIYMPKILSWSSKKRGREVVRKTSGPVFVTRLVRVNVENGIMYEIFKNTATNFFVNFPLHRPPTRGDEMGLWCDILFLDRPSSIMSTFARIVRCGFLLLYALFLFYSVP